jgi:hypothetical protein
MDSKLGVRNAREPSRARMKILRTLLTEHSEGNVMDVQGFVIQPDFASAVKAQPGSTPGATA